MQKINWFPGHMQKTLRMMEEEVKKIDVLIYVLDARAPLACINPEFVKIIGEKPILYVFNKIDLADKNKIKKIKAILLKDNQRALELNSTSSGALKSVEKELNILCNDIIQKYNNKGIKYFVKAMVIGVPNSGKSTLVNNLCGNSKALTGNKPGVTKSKQWVRLLNNYEILDTPGTLWPNLNNEDLAYRLAFIGSIKDEIISIEELAILLIEILLKEYPNELLSRYKLSNKEKKPLEILEKIGETRKLLIKGGEIDYERTAKTIIDDFRKGRIGKITI